MYSSLSKISSSVTRIIAIIFAITICVLTYQTKMSIGEFGLFATLVLKHFFDTSKNQSTVDKSIIVNP